MLTMSSTPLDMKSQLFTKHFKIKLTEWLSKWITYFKRFIIYIEQWVLQPGTVILENFLMSIISYRFRINIKANVLFKCGGGYIFRLSILFCFMKLHFKFKLSSY